MIGVSHFKSLTDEYPAAASVQDFFKQMQFKDIEEGAQGSHE